jgi:hypothetical protein
MDRRGPLLAALVVSGCGRIDYRPHDAASPTIDARTTVDASVDAGGPGCARTRFEEPLLVAEASSASEEVGPTLSRDLLTLYFSSDRPGGVGGLDLYMAVRPSLDQAFETPIEMSALNSAAEEGGPSLSSDGLTMYFHSARSGPRRLYTATRASVGEPFEAFAPVEGALLELINQAHADVSRDDLTLYFESTDPSGAGDNDVWVSTRADRASAWGTPSSLAVVSTADGEGTPSIDASQLTLYLTSSRRETSSDIFVATRAEPSAPFSTPTLLPIASIVGVGEHDVDISDDGSTLVLSLHYGGGLGLTDIWISRRVCDE